MQLWDAERYDRFEAERARPSRELIARIPLRKPRRIVDLGCGSGLSTLELRRAFPESEIVGVDLSPDMLKAAAKKLPDATFLEGDAGRFDARGFDLVFANAVFHWVPDHLGVIARLAAGLPEGGALAFQMPDNEEEPSHRLMRAVAAMPAFRGLADSGPQAGARLVRRLRRRAVAALRRGRPLAHDLRAPAGRARTTSSNGWRARACAPISIRSTPNGARPSWRLTAKPWRRPIRRSANGAVLFPFPRLFAVASRGLTNR